MKKNIIEIRGNGMRIWKLHYWLNESGNCPFFCGIDFGFGEKITFHLVFPQWCQAQPIHVGQHSCKKLFKFKFNDSFKRPFWCVASFTLATDPPPLVAFFGGSKGGGTVENLDPSGACGGLLYLIFFYLYHVSLPTISFDNCYI